MSGLLSVFNSSILSGVRSYLPSSRTGQEGEDLWPANHEEWCKRYDGLDRAYLGLGYRLEMVRKLKLFRAVDPTGQTIAITRRLTRDVQHVVDTDARSMSNGIRIGPEGEDSDEATTERGKAIWKRSKLSSAASRWARLCAGLGDVMMEAVRLDGTAPYDVRIVGYDPRYVQLEYDVETGTEIVKATIEIPYRSSPEAADDITTTEAEEHVYKRVLTKTAIEVFIDGARQEELSGEHKLDAVPLVHVPFSPWTDPAHGLWAAEGLEDALALVDSLLTQMLAVGNRYASPLWVAKGFKLRAGADLNFGRVLSIPSDANFTAQEPSLTGLATLLAAAEATRALARETLPEFLFTDAGASSSGTALNFRATAYVQKMLEVRSARWFPALEIVTEYALALEDGAAYDPEVRNVAVVAPPVLPVNVGDKIDTLIKARDAGGLKMSDFIAHLQTIEIVPDTVDPVAYAAEVAAEQVVLANIEAQALADIAAQVAIPEPIKDTGPEVPVPGDSTTLAGGQGRRDGTVVDDETESDA